MSAQGNSSAGESSSVMGEINVTPMVDVMLVLLIIFMVVTPSLMAGFQARLPTGENLLERPHDENRVTLGIDASGAYYLNRAPIRREDALRLLTAEFASQPLDKVLFLNADRDLPYEEVLEAMSIARDAGARVMAAVTESSTDGSDQGADASSERR